ncbi:MULTISPECIES: hypothetical protein [Catenuloplanes]|uniref:Uncharacterized protein n=1 Tax=Catenuloplanes niger TaxID=587534 RepID=A0AAE4CVM1_9ACTN|nr:hypothetical protein [Catenuloplanes niger]MDR7327536.1 hypothetical protein [Catenuloplanes niger]
MRHVPDGCIRPPQNGTGRRWPVAPVLLVPAGSWAGRPASHHRRGGDRTRTVLL